MKTLSLIFFTTVLIVSCGKKEARKTVYRDAFSTERYVEDMELFMPEIKNIFQDQFITDHFSAETEVIFVSQKLTPGKDSFLNKNFSSLSNAGSCSYYSIRPYSEILLTIKTNYNTCLSPFVSETISYPGDYTYELNPLLKEALDLTPDRIAVREVIYEGETYVGYGIQKVSGFDLSKTYKEYVVIPDFPKVLNPVLTYDSLTGEVTALKGIQVR